MKRLSLKFTRIALCSALSAFLGGGQASAASTKRQIATQPSCEKPLDVATVSPRSPRRSPVATKDAPGNFFLLYEGERNLYRGRLPSNPGHVEYLQSKGVDSILVFKDWRSESEREKLENRYVSAGIPAANLHWISFPWGGIHNYRKLCESTVAALKILKSVVEDSSRRKGEGGLFIHCAAGEDRTGFLAGVFRMLKSRWSLERAFRDELCARGYADGNPKKPDRVAAEVHRTLTPLFEDFARMIREGELDWEHLDQGACQDVRARRGESKFTACF